MPLDSAQRSLRARLAAHRSWANTSDRAARTAPGRQAAMERFETAVDPHGQLDTAERARRAESARKAHMCELAMRSAKARATRKQAHR